jgi:hypothetical protein
VTVLALALGRAAQAKEFVAQADDFKCLTNVAADHDSVCEYVIGPAGLGLTEDVVRSIQATDPRCQ